MLKPLFMYCFKTITDHAFLGILWYNLTLLIISVPYAAVTKTQDLVRTSALQYGYLGKYVKVRLMI